MPIPELAAATSPSGVAYTALVLADVAPIALALAGLALGLIILVVAVRGAARALYHVRRRGSSDAALARLGQELDPRLELIQRRADALRRGQLAPGELVTLVSDVLDEVTAAGASARSIRGPTRGGATHDDLVLELLRASRALESILDACLALEGSTDAERRDRASTVLKWGHLNLIQARASLAEHVKRLEKGVRTGKSWWRASRI